MKDIRKKGLVAEAKVLAYFVEAGIEVFLPYADNGEHDMIILQDGVLKTVSIKYTASKTPSGSWSVTLKNVSRRNHGEVHVKPFSGADILAVYIAPEDRVVLIEGCTNKSAVSIPEECRSG